MKKKRLKQKVILLPKGKRAARKRRKRKHKKLNQIKTQKPKKEKLFKKYPAKIKNGNRLKKLFQWLPRISFKKKKSPKPDKKLPKPAGNVEKPVRIKFKATILILVSVLLVIDLIVFYYKGVLPFYAALIPSVIITLFALLISAFYIRKAREAHKIAENIKMSMIKQTLNIKKNEFETEFDIICDLVKKNDRVTIGEIATVFKITKEKAEEWGRILDEHGLVEMYYPTIGEPELRWKKKN